MNNGSSLSIFSGGKFGGWWRVISCHHRSISFSFSTVPVRFNTMTLRTSGHPATAASTFFFRFTTWPRRYPPSAVITILAPQSWIRSLSASALNPPNTTLWTAPIRAQASMAIAASGTIGR